MPNYYAQVDSRRICVAVLDMGAIYTDPFYYPIAEYDLNLLGLQLDINITPGEQVDDSNFNEPNESTLPPDTATENGVTTSGNCCLLFPETLVRTCNINLKGYRMCTYNTDSSYFWQYFAYGGTYEYWDATTHYFSDNTSDQTIVDIAGSGVLTNIICPVPDGNVSTVTVTITIDGIDHIFESRTNDTNNRYCLGYLAPEYDSSDDDDDRIHYPSSNWRESDREMYVLIPPTTIHRGKAGIKFNDTLEIKIRSNTGWRSSGQDCIGGASYLTYIPFGL